jgi:DNA-directed RNA polymerase specialized sigma24 family protein
MTDHEQDEFELFRRAIMERSEQAWAEIHRRFRPLLIAWAYRSSARLRAGEWCDDIADQALARAWVALTPEHFAEFPTLSRLLSYLRTCVASTVIDCVRAQNASQRAENAVRVDMERTPEQIVLAGLDRAELWRMALGLTANRAERVVLVESFALSLPPRTIQERHPQLFADVADVYGAKRNLFARLHRNRDLLRLSVEYAPA